MGAKKIWGAIRLYIKNKTSQDLEIPIIDQSSRINVTAIKAYNLGLNILKLSYF